MLQWKVEFYQLANGSSPPLDWFFEQDTKVQAKFARIFKLLQEHGISLGMPHVRPIKNSKLFEIRVEQKTNIYRIFYFAYTGRRFILLHGFQKKTQKTPAKEIEIAESRRAEFLAQENN
ncbi:MAG: type II toxin-antitoxin system RelE/ParE family toxin [Moorea sp. SIO4A1]|nr:type II toxin-antitoxin system RelE/ParE family toxin [Moorena sp. SIO4A5]NEQ60234.1 type II toxin-antitoxin system RelE/ParE family toxin [Moorena sp. SIO4A1]